MTATREYRVVALKHGGGGLKPILAPADDEAASTLNREGAPGRDPVNAICAGPAQPTVSYIKRPR